MLTHYWVMSVVQLLLLLYEVVVVVMSWIVAVVRLLAEDYYLDAASVILTEARAVVEQDLAVSLVANVEHHYL